MPPSSPLPHLWRAVDQDGMVLDVLVQSRRDKHAAKRLLRKLLKKQMRSPRLLITAGKMITCSGSSLAKLMREP
jgi:transposase-like protein